MKKNPMEILELPQNIISNIKANNENLYQYVSYKKKNIQSTIQLKLELNKLYLEPYFSNSNNYLNDIESFLQVKINWDDLKSKLDLIGSSIYSFRVIFHLPLEKHFKYKNDNEIVENYLNNTEGGIDRLGLIYLINMLKIDKNPIILLTSKKFFQNLESQYSSEFVVNIIPVYIETKVPATMLCRQFLYYKLLRKMLGWGRSNTTLIFQDSDVIPIKDDEAICSYTKEYNSLVFSVRNRPDLLPVNGGLYYAPITDLSCHSFLLILQYYWLMSVESYEIINKHSHDIRHWDGDQLSLCKFVDCIDRPGIYKNKVSHQNFLLLSTNKLNFTLIKPSVLNEIKFLPYYIHIKGKAKKSLDLNSLSKGISELITRLK